MRSLIFVATLLTALITSRIGSCDEADFFERSIRPILVDRCLSCHGSNERSGGLRLDSHEGLLQGGDSGKAIVIGDAAASLIVQAIERSGDLAMPPDEELSEVEMSAIRTWIDSGAPWPDSTAVLTTSGNEEWKSHWAFQPIGNPSVPDLDSPWIKTPIDAFILRKLQTEGLQPSPVADARTRLRRASYAVTGLPPTEQALRRFAVDPSESSWQREVDQLLASGHYGEQWARHWLDVARYADTKGYVYAREERFWIHAWVYRDWVIRALNDDMSYDRFVQLQIAADQIEDRDQDDLAAMGYLTLGRRFLGIPHDIIDDRIDVICRGMMGLTVACARCHDHKYDPIPTADYYSLYGVFQSSYEKVVPIPGHAADDAFQDELAKRQAALDQGMAKTYAAASTRYRDRISEYLIAQTELHRYPKAGFDQIIAEDDIHPRIVWRINHWIFNAIRRDDPVFRAWGQFQELPKQTFAADSKEVVASFAEASPEQINPLISGLFVDSPPKSMVEVATRYGDLFTKINERCKKEPDAKLEPAEEQLRQFLYSDSSPIVIPQRHISNNETLLASNEVNATWSLQNAVDKWIIDAKSNPAFALTLADKPLPIEPRVFRRGQANNPGQPVTRHFLSLFSPESQPSDFRTGSGRLELAQSITSPDNPLAARVIVNRVWAHYFGQGLVPTTSDFGLRAASPSHPELLDWLANWFVKNDWKLKRLHRLILTSAVFQQSALTPGSYEKIDPENRLISGMTAHRLTFEEFRDTLLRATSELSSDAGGRPFDLFAGQSPRRTIYGLVDRQYLPATLRTFDFPNPDLHTPKRAETTVPQQALFFLNHSLVLDRVKKLGELAERFDSDEQRVDFLFSRVLQRGPTALEREEATMLLASNALQAEPLSPKIDDWSYGYGEVIESENRIEGFKQCPHFTGTDWQGGPVLPDPELGWVNLHALGGHPGNTRAEACVRRWTAPREMTVRIESVLQHEPSVSDGVRAFVLSGKQTLQQLDVFNQTVQLDVTQLKVSKGQTIDFVVDINKELNSDQFAWRIEVTDVQQPDDRWDSKEDFTRSAVSQLTPLEQLAHVLLCTNEFLFVD
jgi:hypothetical protein